MRPAPPAVSMTWSSQILSYNVRGLVILVSGTRRRANMIRRAGFYALPGEEGRGAKSAALRFRLEGPHGGASGLNNRDMTFPIIAARDHVRPNSAHFRLP